MTANLLLLTPYILFKLFSPVNSVPILQPVKKTDIVRWQKEIKVVLKSGQYKLYRHVI